jgi:hypothetical protein
MHGLIIPFEIEWNPLIFIGDIHLRSLMSWSTNEANYGRQWEVYERAEKDESMPLQPESSDPHELLQNWFTITYGVHFPEKMVRIFDLRK